MDVNSTGYIIKKIAALSFLVILTMCIAPCRGAPRNSQRTNHPRRHDHSRAASGITTTTEAFVTRKPLPKVDLRHPPWWRNPCLSRPPVHARSMRHVKQPTDPLFRPVKLHMKTLYNHFKDMKKRWIRRNYIIGISNEELLNTVRREWVPVSYIDQYNTKFNRTKRQNRYKMVKFLFPKLHEGIQIYANIFENMYTMDLSVVSNFDRAARATILADISDDLRGMLCEIETTLHNFNLPQPRHKKRERLESKYPWKQRPDSTSEFFLQDKTAFLSYESFLAEWFKIINDMCKRGPNGLSKCNSGEFRKRRLNNRENSTTKL